MPNEFSINQESNNQTLFLHVSAPETPLLNGSDPPGPEFEVLASHSAQGRETASKLRIVKGL